MEITKSSSINADEFLSGDNEIKWGKGKCEFCGRNNVLTTSTMLTGNYCLACYKTLFTYVNDILKSRLKKIKKYY